MSDGRVITLTRHQEFSGPHELGDTPTVSDYWIEFNHPVTGDVVRWESSRSLGVKALFLDKSTPIILVSPRFGEWGKRNCPIPPYLLFRYERGRWGEADLSTIPEKIVKPNLTIDPRSDRAKIEGSNFHLNSEQTQAQFYGRNWRYVIDFTGAQAQSFGIDNCNSRQSTEDLYRIRKIEAGGEK